MEKIKDMIYRQDAIDALDEIESEVADGDGFQYEKWRKHFCEMTSARPDHIADGSKKGDTINRQAAADALMAEFKRVPTTAIRARAVLEQLPPEQPERIQSNAVHLCDSCQYTHVTCPSHGNDAVFGDGKGNDNICACNKYRPISAQPEQQWIPFKTRTLTEEEKEEYPEWDSILDCKLPDDGQRILVSVSLRGHECVQYDEFYTDAESYLDSGYEIGTEAVAWIPLPEPYTERRKE